MVTSANRKWVGLVAVALGVSVIVIDTTIVNVIVPSLITDLAIGSREAQWVQESYAIIFAGLLLVAGRVSDLWGARRAFLVAIVAFGVASAAAAISGSGSMLIASRFAQGATAALLLPASLALINANFEGQDRNKAFAVWGSTIGAGAAVGPLLGGWLDEYSWRLVFGINIVIVPIVLAGVRAYLDPTPSVRGRVDSIGAVLSALGLGLLAFGLIEGRVYGWFESKEALSLAGVRWSGTPSPVFVALAAAALLLGLLVWQQLRLTRKDGMPLIDTRLFRIRSFGLGNVATLLIGLGEFGIIAVIPLWLQFALGYSAIQAGLALVALAVGSFAASGASFALATRSSAVALVRIGLVLEIVGLTFLGLIASDTTTWWQIGGALFVYGVGVGFATAQVTNVVLTDLPARSMGSASGVQSAIRQTGSALGIAILTTVFYTGFASGLDDRLAERVPNAPAGISSTIVDTGGAPLAELAKRERTEPVAAAGQEAMGSAVSKAAFVSAGLLVIGLLATSLIGGRAKGSDRVLTD